MTATPPKAVASRVLVALIGLMIVFDAGWLVAHSDEKPLRWRRATGPGFSVTFPGAPRSESRNIPVRGTNVVAHLLILDARHKHSFGLLYADYPPVVDVSNAPAVLDGAAKGSASSVSGTLASTAPTTVLGQPAIDYVIRVKARVVKGRKVSALVIRGRSMLVDHRLYSLLVGTPNDEPADYRRFVASLRLGS
jgi:hypothetical protein